MARRQVTPAALCAATGISRSTLDRKLSGHGDLTVTQLVRLAIALEVPAVDLLAVVEETVRGEETGTQTQQ